MHFLYPEFLYGLFLLTIPILLHLFSLKKYKKVYFSNFTFLEALQQQRKNSSRLKNIILLLLRLLAISSIVIAFASPYVNPEKRLASLPDNPSVIIYADNSFSMTNTGSQGSLLEEAKKYLYDIVSSYPNGSSFKWITNDMANDLSLTKEQMYNALSQLKISPASKPLSQIFKEIHELKGTKPTTFFILSDFQKQNCDFQNILPDSTLTPIFLMLKPENHNNVYIREISFENPFHQKNQTEKLHISVVNTSDRELHNLPVTLTINNKKKSISQIDLLPNSEKKLEISHLNTEDGFYKGMVELTDFPVIFDNKFFFSYTIDNKAKVLYIWQTQANPYFGKLFSDTSAFSFTSSAVQQLSNQNLSGYNLIILDDVLLTSSGLESLLEEYLINGGNLFILPGSRLQDNRNHFLQKIQAPQFGQRDTNTTIAYIETQASLFRNVFEQEDKKAVLPQIRTFFPLSSTGAMEKLLSDKRNNTLLAAKVYGKGNLYVSAFSFDPENSDMVYHPLFIPLLANMACRVNSALNTAYFLNAGQPVTIDYKKYRENSTLQIRSEDRSFEFIPEFRKNFSGDLLLANSGNIQDAGLYEVIQDNQVIDVLAWNYNRTESSMDFCREEELQKQFPTARVENIKTTRLDHNSELVKEIVHQDNNKYLTVWFLILAVITLLLEQMVWKRKLN